MAIELKVPPVGESITEVEIGAWLKQPGDRVEKDEPLVEIESDKATVEVSAPVAGTLSQILKRTGEAAVIGEVIGAMEAGPVKAGAEKIAVGVAASVTSAAAGLIAEKPLVPSQTPGFVMPSAQRLLAEKGLRADEIAPSGPAGRVLKEDVMKRVAAPAETGRPAAAPPQAPKAGGAREEEVVRMTPLRRAASEVLLRAQQNMALLTTFNECDMTAVMAMRNRYKQAYEEKYGIKLGFMSFFVKAVIEGLKEYPATNAEVRGQDIVYKNYYDIGIAVSGKKGLVVPVLRGAERLSFAEIERVIADMGKRARDGKLSPDELTGGTFTITNGGIFGSLMSTPIVNPPQSAILGMHAIKERPAVVDGAIVPRPMMYLALTYDHRVIDGREAVGFLVRVKECIEDPARILVEV
jgi:2-oxoglutarate dehydrogenase E2 component (dihydrolipoamide succinyltransferase)